MSSEGDAISFTCVPAALSPLIGCCTFPHPGSLQRGAPPAVLSYTHSDKIHAASPFFFFKPTLDWWMGMSLVQSDLLPSMHSLLTFIHSFIFPLLLPFLSLVSLHLLLLLSLLLLFPLLFYLLSLLILLFHLLLLLASSSSRSFSFSQCSSSYRFPSSRSSSPAPPPHYVFRSILVPPYTSPPNQSDACSYFYPSH